MAVRQSTGVCRKKRRCWLDLRQREPETTCRVAPKNGHTQDVNLEIGLVDSNSGHFWLNVRPKLEIELLHTTIDWPDVFRIVVISPESLANDLFNSVESLFREVDVLLASVLRQAPVV
jgi:hypothetical protein